MSVLGEIRRRKVFQVAVVYAVVGWLLIQIAATIEQPLSLPDHFDTLVIVLVAIGFPIALILSWIFDVTPGGVVVTGEGHNDRRAGHTGGAIFTYVIQGLVLVAVAWLIADEYLQDRAGVAERTVSEPTARFDGQVRFSFVPPEWQADAVAGQLAPLAAVDISPDDTQISYSAATGVVVSALAELHDLSRRTRIDLPGGFGVPMFSPDSNSLAILTGMPGVNLFRVNTDGSGADEIEFDGNDSALRYGVSLQYDANLYYSRTDGLAQLPMAGGEARLVVTPDVEDRLLDASLLPGGEYMLVTRVPAGNALGDKVFEVRSLADGSLVRVLGAGYAARFVATGHVLFVSSDMQLYAQRFDLETLSLVGDPLLVASEIQRYPGEAGKPFFGLSADGTLVYAAGGSRPTGVWHWIAADGPSELAPDLRSLTSPELSRDGTRILFVYNAGDDTFGNPGIYQYDLRSGLMQSLTQREDGGNLNYPIYGQDGNIVFAADGGIRVLSPNGNPGSEPIIPSVEALGADRQTRSTSLYAETSRGDILIRDSVSPGSGLDIGMVSRARPDEPIRWLVTGDGDQQNATLSDNERLMAYQDCPSESSSRRSCMIYVKEGLDLEAPVQPVGYGIDPQFVGNTLYFLQAENDADENEGPSVRLRYVEYDPDADGFVPVGAIEDALDVPVIANRAERNYVAGLFDGRFLVRLPDAEAEYVPPAIHIWINFLSWLERNPPVEPAN